ncbi:M23 family metallopeptidase [Paenibacillus sp. HB172176]|uniref:M23 family metallopeptidase n=1 Tax=Paenibacillus sp. HB172176 TaxID=2493690 RepID=UPI001438F39B|nr:M23 family metallopeptidase [Paenibacillus sp. HB172176]
MKWISKPFTFVVIPDANQAVQRYRIPRIIIIILPVLFLLFIISTALLIYLFSGNTSRIHELKNQLSRSEAGYEQLLSSKENQISTLEDSLALLSDQAELMENKMSEITELDQQLKEIAGIKEPKVQISSILDEKNDGQGGEEFLMYPSEQVGPANGAFMDGTDGNNSLLIETMQSYSSLSATMEELKPQLQSTKEALLQYQHILSITPTIWPADSRRITSEFGVRKDPITGRSAFHSGLDLGGTRGDPVYATADGVVVKSEREYPYGNNIIIDHGRGIETRYMHMNKLLAKVGEKVVKGQVIGELGNTGRSTGPHIHYEVIVNGTTVDPAPYIKEE